MVNSKRNIWYVLRQLGISDLGENRVLPTKIAFDILNSRFESAYLVQFLKK
jgi:hypothetical protein